MEKRISTDPMLLKDILPIWWKERFEKQGIEIKPLAISQQAKEKAK